MSFGARDEAPAISPTPNWILTPALLSLHFLWDSHRNKDKESQGVVSSSLLSFQGSAERLLRITTGIGEAAQGLKRGHPVPFEALRHI